MAEISMTWLDYNEVAEKLGVSSGKVRQLVQERSLLSRRRDGVWQVPEALLDDKVMGDVKGTATVLVDGGFTADEALTWLLRDENALGATPLEAIRQGRKTEVRRLAQSLAL